MNRFGDNKQFNMTSNNFNPVCQKPKVIRRQKTQIVEKQIELVEEKKVEENCEKIVEIEEVKLEVIEEKQVIEEKPEIEEEILTIEEVYPMKDDDDIIMNLETNPLLNTQNTQKKKTPKLMHVVNQMMSQIKYKKECENGWVS